MKLNFNIYYKGTNGSAKAFSKEMMDCGLVYEIRKLEGNLQYDYFISLEDEETILLVDRWENQLALNNYHNGDLMKKVLIIREKYDLQMEVKRFLDDSDSINSQDKKFISNMNK